ncbi:hypothetical protein QTG54_009045 [Skeletonema marinoi]|uniref:Uncharacterized protein n=1 Tax=Skeletonema marinoi TaxID=267567 RepID=A0AAD8Y6N6_9STRA|nr:hypothetical protein QTG54_009045 [Skeletonema marinoi]
MLASSDNIKNFLAHIAVHMKRPLGWRLAAIVEPSQSEANTLNMKSEDICSVMQSYLVWRRSSMLVSLPIMFYATLSGFLEMNRFREEEYDVLKEYGLASVVTFIYAVPSIADAVLFLGAIGAHTRWHEWHYTSRVLKYGWLVSTLLPLIPVFVPFGVFVSKTYKDKVFEECRQGQGFFDDYIVSSCDDFFQGTISTLKMTMAFYYGIKILPLILTFPSSCVRAALRIRGLIPDSSFSSWMISIAAPFQSMLILVSLIFLIQMAGNVCLVIAALLLCLSPWMYVIRLNLYVSISSDEREKQIDKNQNIMSCMYYGAIILLVVWAHTETLLGQPLIGPHSEEYTENPVMTYNYFFQLVFESFGRLLLTTVVFGDALLCMTVKNFQHNQCRIQHGATWQRVRETFKSLEYITQPKQNNDEADTDTAEQAEHPQALGNFQA